MADITEIAVASWRLEKWLDNVNVERKMAAKSALRSIKKYLQENEIEVLDLTGSKFDVGLAVSVVNNEAEGTDEDQLIISEMVKPIIKEKGAVIQYGQVILGSEVKKPKANNVVEDAPKSAAVDNAVAIAAEIDAANKVPSQDTSAEVCTQSDTPLIQPADTEKSSKPKLWAWIIVAALQIAAIILLIVMISDVNTLKQNTAVAAAQSVVTYDVPSEDTAYDVEGGIDALSERIDAVEEKIDGIDSSLSDVETTINAISELTVTSQETAAADEEAASSDSQINYVVEAGDTLISICRKNGIDYYACKDEIMELNNMTDPGKLYIGQELILPAE